MTWFKVDDGFYDHPKTDGMELEAIGLWLVCGTYCARHLTDGVVTVSRIRRFGGSDDMVATLVDSGLWTAHGDDYRFNDWCDYQPTRETVLADRERERQRKQKQRESKRNPAGVPGGVPPGVPLGQPPESHPESQGVSGHPDPTRPDPTRPPTKSVARKKQATPAPDIFPITDAMRKWAASKAPAVDIDDETEKLLDWARANGKTYTDWVATWRNWMRREPQFRPRSKPQPVQGTLALAQRLRAQEQQ